MLAVQAQFSLQPLSSFQKRSALQQRLLGDTPGTRVWSSHYLNAHILRRSLRRPTSPQTTFLSRL